MTCARNGAHCGLRVPLINSMIYKEKIVKNKLQRDTFFMFH